MTRPAGLTDFTPSDLRKTLRECYLFSSLDSRDLQAVASACLTITTPKRADIFAMGDEADGLRIILSGVVRVWISDEDGQELTVALLEEGDSFGEIALFDNLPRTASASAVEEVKCLFVPQHSVKALLATSPRFALDIIRVLCETLRRNTDEMGAVMFRSLDRRLAQKLLDLAMAHAVIRDNSAAFTRKFSQSDLGKMLGVTRESVNKNLTALVEAGLVELQGGLMHITDIKALAKRN